MNRLQLPENYAEFGKINYKKNTRLNIIITVSTLIGALLMIVIAGLITGFNSAVATFMSNGIKNPIITIVGVLLIPSVQEGLKGLIYTVFCKGSAKFSFDGLGLKAVGRGFYDKKSFILANVLPSVTVAVILAVANAVAGKDLFWVIYLMQVYNIAGSADQYCIAATAGKMSRKMLVQMSGHTARFFKKVQPPVNGLQN